MTGIERAASAHRKEGYRKVINSKTKKKPHRTPIVTNAPGVRVARRCRKVAVLNKYAGNP